MRRDRVWQEMDERQRQGLSEGNVRRENEKGRKTERKDVANVTQVLVYQRQKLHPFSFSPPSKFPPSQTLVSPSFFSLPFP